MAVAVKTTTIQDVIVTCEQCSVSVSDNFIDGEAASGRKAATLPDGWIGVPETVLIVHGGTRIILFDRPGTSMNDLVTFCSTDCLKSAVEREIAMLSTP